MNRIFDFLVSLLIIILLLFPFLIFTFIILTVDGFPIIYWSKRVGKKNKIFYMPKFRTMKKNTPELATHLLENPNKFILPFGNFFRKTSIDELPQFISVFFGKMSIVGPRPALYNQDDLIILRDKYKISDLKPGITGYAQINGRDNISIAEKVELERKYLSEKSLFVDIKIIFKTLIILYAGKNVKH